MRFPELGLAYLNVLGSLTHQKVVVIYLCLRVEFLA